MPRKKIIISSVLILSSILVVYFFNTKNRIQIQGTAGPVKVYNFFPHSENKIDKNTFFIKEHSSYTISYFKPDSLFLITLENKNLLTARTSAEKEFLKQLKISKDAACELNLDMEVPDYIDNDLSGVNYNLSFCPDGIPFNQTQANGGQTDNSNSSQSTSLLQKLLNVFKNPLTVALGAAFVIVAGIILFARR
jgi:hypothetical protein